MAETMQNYTGKTVFKLELQITCVFKDEEEVFVCKCIKDGVNMVLKVKCYGDVRKEADIMRIARAHVPVPCVYECGWSGKFSYILMDYVKDSVMLCDVDHSDMPEELWDDLRSKVAAIRSVSIGYPGYDTSEHSLRFCGFSRDTYYSSKEFMARRAAFTGMGTEDMPELHSNRLSLSHCDLWPYNVMVSEDLSRVTAIIDWETAGYYPDLYEHCVYFMRLALDNSWSDFDDRWVDMFSVTDTRAIRHIEIVIHEKILSRWKAANSNDEVQDNTVVC